MSTTDNAPIVLAGEPTRDDSSTARLVAFATVAALLAGLASWGAAEVTHDRMELRTATFKGIPTTAENVAAAAMLTTDLAKRASVAFGLLGGFLGLALGAAGGLARGSTRAAIMAAVVGGVLGAAVGAASARIGFQEAPRLLPPMMDDLIAAMLVQGIIGGLIGAAAGSALAVGSGWCIVRGAVGGLVGGAAGLVVHQLVGAAAFPMAATTEALAAIPSARVTTHILPAVMAAVGSAVALAAGPRLKRSEAVT
jgi:hypothetical protein